MLNPFKTAKRHAFIRGAHDPNLTAEIDFELVKFTVVETLLEIHASSDLTLTPQQKGSLRKMIAYIRATHIPLPPLSFKLKLNPRRVREIRHLAKTTRQRIIANHFGVSTSTISQIVNRITWANVD